MSHQLGSDFFLSRALSTLAASRIRWVNYSRSIYSVFRLALAFRTRILDWAGISAGGCLLDDIHTNTIHHPVVVITMRANPYYNVDRPSAHESTTSSYGSSQLRITTDEHLSPLCLV